MSKKKKKREGVERISLITFHETIVVVLSRIIDSTWKIIPNPICAHILLV
jgi:hypothetical protein